MKRTTLLVLTEILLAVGLTVPCGYAQTFAFSTIAGGTQGSNDGVGLGAQFSKPAGVAVDASGNVYVADQLNNAVRELTPLGTNWFVAIIAGGTAGSRDGTNTAAQFSGPSGIAVDSATNLYVADQLNYTIRKITPAGTNWVVSTVAGQVNVAGANDGTNTAAQFHNPAAVAVDGAGNLFVADEFNNAIRKITPQGTNWIVTTIAGGSNGAANGTNTAAQFYDPAGIAVDTNDRVFVADQFNNAIRLITPVGSNWVVTTIAGQLIAGASNGLGTNAQFNSPVGVALDSNENVFVSDLFNNAIREMMPTNTNWIVSTIGGGSNGTNNGTGTNAQFYLPFGVTTDVYGDIFVADSGNNAIRLGVSSSGVPQVGSLQVTLMPSNAVSAGAAWQLDGGPFQTNGASLTNLSPGNYVITFSNVSGFTTPAYQDVIVTAHQTMTATGNYATAIPNAGSLQVLIAPDAVVEAGAQWQVDDGALQTNAAIVAGLSVGSHTLAFTAVSGWTTPATQTVAVTNSQTTLGLGTYEPANGPVTNYTITLNALPAADGTVSGGGTFPAGSTQTITATANSNFEFVAWIGEATGTSNPLTVTVNTNLDIIAFFAPAGSTSLTVFTNGEGRVAPNENGRELKAGRTYSLEATAISGNVFSGWTGSLTTNKDPLAFKLESSMVLQANFIPNPFLPIKGTYNGLFTATNGVTEQTAGMLKGLVIGQQGTYSGALLINGASHPITGRFNLAGQAANQIMRATSQGGPLLLEMTLDWNDSPPELTGMVSGTTWAANLVADLAADGLPAPEYTMLIPPDTNNAPPNSSPGGDGYALIANVAGRARITGALAEGTSFSQSVPASQDGYVPVYASLYAGKGLLLGWINLDLTNTAGVGLTWIHPARAVGLYQNGFTNVLLANLILLSPWTNPPANLDLLTNLSLVDTIAASNTPIPVTIISGVVSGADVTGTINSRTGLLRVAIGSGPSRVVGYGAVLLNATNGGGYFLTATNAQAIKLQP